MKNGTSIAIRDRGRRERRPTSLEPRPNPETTLPFIRRGKGASGPESGPITVGRGPSGRILSGVERQTRVQAMN
jgi:hypothetical protein